MQSRSTPAYVSVEAGLSRYLDQIGRFPLLEAEEEYMLAKRWLAYEDRDAAQKLVTSHLRLVAKVAMSHRGYGLPIADIISEGNVGLMQAIRKFDPEKGFRLSTYALWWIRAAIQDYVLRSWSIVRMGTGANQKKLFFGLRRAKREISALGSGDLRPDQVSAVATRLGVPGADVIEMNRRLAADGSLNAPMRHGEAGGGDWQDQLADEADSAETVIAERQEAAARRDALHLAVARLTGRERDIFEARRLRDNPITLGELADRYGVSGERIRQIEVRAFGKVREAVTGRSAEPSAPPRTPTRSKQAGRPALVETTRPLRP